MSFYLAIVSPLDTPLFELSFSSSKAPSSATSTTFPSWSSFTSSHANGDALASPSSGYGGYGQGYGGGSSGTAAGGVAGGQAGAGQSAGSGSGGPGGGPGTGGPAGGIGGIGMGGAMDRSLLQMIAHASLDAVEEAAEGTGSLYLKAVDRHNEWTVSAFLATNVKLILLHDAKNDDGIRLFFGDVWEHYVKVALNPFHTVNTPIRNALFETKVKTSARKFL